MKKAKNKGNCWIWQYAVNKDGYGQVQHNKVRYEAHRWMYEMIKGKVPHKSELDHLCRNRACVNPEHLEPVSHAENCRRGNNAKLGIVQIDAIKKLSGKMTQKEIAEKYGVSRSMIGLILQGKRWA